MWPRDPAVVFEPGTVLAGKFRVERPLGAGGMGVVLAVRHADLEEVFALKLLHPAAASSPAARERFAREAKAAARLKSPHVARVTDFGFLDDDGAPYMVLELLDGENLAERLSSRGLASPAEIASWMLEACDALREAHELGIVHRDIKPSNLFLSTAGEREAVLKVLDFGIAKTGASDHASLTKTSTTMGSPLYMSPEQMRSAKSADRRSDIWSLGVTMYELATGRVPFAGDSVTEVAIAVIELDVEPPRAHRPELPAELEAIILRCLQKKPERRFQEIDELAGALAAFSGRSWTPRSRPLVAPVSSTSPLATSPLAVSSADAFAATEAGASSGASADKDATIAAAPVLTHLGSKSQAATGGGTAIDGATTQESARRMSGPRRALAVGVLAAAGLGLTAVVTLLSSSASEDPRAAPPTLVAAASSPEAPPAPPLPTVPTALSQAAIALAPAPQETSAPSATVAAQASAPSTAVAAARPRPTALKEQTTPTLGKPAPVRNMPNFSGASANQRRPTEEAKKEAQAPEPLGGLNDL
ncbi:MAG: protein kinase [Polyangiaceae bacterium]|nr:protein kinase [Polyangiaceae bacterium]